MGELNHAPPTRALFALLCVRLEGQPERSDHAHGSRTDPREQVAQDANGALDLLFPVWTRELEPRGGVGQIRALAKLAEGTTVFNQPLGAWDVAKVTNMLSFFKGATAFNQPLQAWDVGQVTAFGSAFDNTGLSDCNKRAIHDSFEAQVPSVWAESWGSLC